MSVLFTPRQAAGLLGVSESTVRRWCDAGFIATTRTAGGHRRIQRQALLRFARERGLDMLDIAPVATAGRGGRLPELAELSARFYQQLVNGGEKEVQQFVLELVGRIGDSAVVCDHIIAPAMHRVGEQWSANRLRIFSEHAATQRAAAALTIARSQLTTLGVDAPSAVCAAMAGDPYSLAPAMCSLVFTAAGFRVTLLGPNTPASEIVQAAAELSATVIAVSVSAPPLSHGELAALCTKADELGIRVALGGRMLKLALRKQLSPDFFGDTMGHLSSYANRLMQTLRGQKATGRDA